MFSAQYRFFIDVFFVIFFVMFHQYFDKKKSIAVCSGLGLLIISILSFPGIIQTYIPSFRVGGFMAGLKKEQLYRPSAYEYRKFNSFRIGNLEFNVSENYPYNFETPLPAISTGYIFDDMNAGIFLQLIDKKDISKGFIWQRMTSDQKKEGEKVIYIIKNTDK